MNNEKEQLRKLNHYLSESYAEPLTIEEIAGYMGMSVSMLYRFSMKSYGHAIMDELKKVRMEKAMELLVQTNFAVTEVAMRCGYNNTSTFNRQFKDFYGETPSGYRKASCAEAPACVYLDRNSDCEKHNPWNIAINIGPIEVLLRNNVRQQIKNLRDECRIKYFRIWNIFSDWLIIERNKESALLRFDCLDEILDFFIDSKVKPWIDLGSKVLQSFYSKNEISSNLDLNVDQKDTLSYQRWEKLVHEFILHIIRRYGTKEVQSWIFEIYQPIVENRTQQDNFFQFYENVIGYIKKLLPDAWVGGCGWSDSRKFGMMTGYISKMRIKPDFVSLYYYPLDRDQKFYKLPDVLRTMREELSVCSLDDIKVFLTEWNLTLINNEDYNDSMRKALDIIKLTVRNLKEADVGAYFIGSDSVLGTKGKGLHCLFGGGLGLYSASGIKKPSFFAVRAVCSLGNKILGVEDGYAVSCSEKRIQILLWNDGEDKESARKGFRLEVQNIENGLYLRRRCEYTDHMEDYFHCRDAGAEDFIQGLGHDMDTINYPVMNLQTVRITNKVLSAEEYVKANSYVFYEFIQIG